MTKAEAMEAVAILAGFDRLARARNAALRPSSGISDIVGGLREYPGIQSKVHAQLRAFTVAALDEHEAKMRGRLAALGVVEEDKPASDA